jgi:GNAT superfamily N-acetyltransferase
MPKPAAARAIIRPHRIGDMGFVVHRHGVLYFEEYGFDITFEALVARIAADFIDTFDPVRCCSRIAEVDGAIVGSAFVVPAGVDTPDTAKLRLVYLEPQMRGSGLARQMVLDCMAFAKSAGYRRMTLWTQDILIPARRLYASLGFARVASSPFEGFGQTMVNETWVHDL